MFSSQREEIHLSLKSRLGSCCWICNGIAANSLILSLFQQALYEHYCENYL